VWISSISGRQICIERRQRRTIGARRRRNSRTTYPDASLRAVAEADVGQVIRGMTLRRQAPGKCSAGRRPGAAPHFDTGSAASMMSPPDASASARPTDLLQRRDDTVSDAWPDDDIILYDGVCIFCSHWIRFVARRDINSRFRFTPIQSAYGSRLARHFGIDPHDPDTNAVIHGGVAYFKSDAALTVLSLLPGWRWAGVLRGVPAALRNPVYNLIARNRYRIFGRSDACMVPDAALRARVIE
jgi:predicted DCC family thiol-disulfide oxidoreductase YuxK